MFLNKLDPASTSGRPNTTSNKAAGHEGTNGVRLGPNPAVSDGRAGCHIGFGVR